MLGSASSFRYSVESVEAPALPSPFRPLYWLVTGTYTQGYWCDYTLIDLHAISQALAYM
jgi:hypothetical protein